jgi:hypothetical protein
MGTLPQPPQPLLLRSGMLEPQPGSVQHTGVQVRRAPHPRRGTVRTSKFSLRREGCECQQDGPLSSQEEKVQLTKRRDTEFSMIGSAQSATWVWKAKIQIANQVC